MPDAPEWVIATGYVGGIQMVTPRLISGELLNKTVVHELTHAIQGQINPVAPFWMIEVVAMYESEMFESVRERVSQGIKENNIPALASLEALDEEGFEQAGGYAYGYTVVEFSVETYGKEILPEWVKTPQEYERVFGVSGENFEKQWLAWLVDRYAEP